MTIFDEVLSFIREPHQEFPAQLALRVFQYQYQQVSAYRNFIDRLGLEAAAIKRIEQVPPLSTVAFKFADLESRAEMGSAKVRQFFTSGTTIGKIERGRHAVVRPEIYQASAIAHLRRMLFPDRAKLAMLALHPTAERMPESSLAQMLSWCMDQFGTGDSFCAATPEGVDVAAAMDFLREHQSGDEAVCVLATTAACAKLFSAIGSAGMAIKLPIGSRMMDTGGTKGQVNPLDQAEVVTLAGRLLGIAPEMVINEYGMTEMCSQLYDATPFNLSVSRMFDGRVKLAPPWLQPFALDPVTLRPVGDGERGLLAFFDIANVGSVSMLLTEDVGVIAAGTVQVVGRSAASEPRGCALGLQEFAANAVGDN